MDISWQIPSSRNAIVALPGTDNMEHSAKALPDRPNEVSSDSTVPLPGPGGDSRHGRYEKTLQGLLNMSTSLPNYENGHSESETDIEEKRKFLCEVLDSLSPVSELEVMRKLVEDLKQSTSANSSVEEIKNILEEISEHAYSIDMAIFFFQVGGLDLTTPLLSHQNPSLRSVAADLIAVCCRNNPYCQNLTIDDKLFKTIINLLSDGNDAVKSKAISAISAIVQHCSRGETLFCKYNGFQCIERTLTSQNKQIIHKASFFLSRLAVSDNETIQELLLTLIPKLIQLTKAQDNEDILQTLATLMSKYPSAVEEVFKEEHKFEKYLSDRLAAKVEEENEVDMEGFRGLVREILTMQHKHRGTRRK